MPPATVIRSLLVFDEQHPLYRSYKIAKRVAIGIVGGTVLLVGVAMIILPGPAFVVIPVGLGILSLEFAWARSWLKKIKDRAKAMSGARDAKPGEPGPRR